MYNSACVLFNLVKKENNDVINLKTVSAFHTISKEIPKENYPFKTTSRLMISFDPV